MPFKFNPLSGQLDLVEDSDMYLRKDQSDSTPYYLTVDRLYLGGSTNTYFALTAGNTLELYVNGDLREQWTSLAGTPTTGNPMGLLLSLTYPS